MNGLTTTYGYDSASRLTHLQHAQGSTPLEQITYALDANGNRTQQTNADGVTSYRYDALNRLVQIDDLAIPGGPDARSTQYGYDALGNRTTVNGVPAYSYDASGRITTPGFSYDGNGNLLNDGATAYTYDAANRLIGTASGGTTTAYAYDGWGNLVRETVNGVATDLLVDEGAPLPTILGEVRADGSEQRYAYGPDGVAAQQRSVNGSAQPVAFPLLDGLGSVRRLTDSMGATGQVTSYDAFGVVRHQTGAAATTLGFTGERIGTGDGLVYLRARHYAPELGRFLQRDTFAGFAERPSSLNRYTYTENNPATLIDPTGYWSLPAWVSKAGQFIKSGANTTGQFIKSGYNTVKNWVNSDTVKKVVGTAADLAPVVGDVKGFVEVFTGCDLVTNEDLGHWRWLGVIGLSEFRHGRNLEKFDDYIDLATPEKRRHILDGDDTGGGHRPGTGKPGKSEFPADWSDDKIMHAISDVATDPASNRSPGYLDRTKVQGTHDGIDITVILGSPAEGGGIWTAHPTNVPRNPRR